MSFPFPPARGLTRLGMNGGGNAGTVGTCGYGWPSEYIDVWVSNAQTGPYTIYQYDVTQKDFLPSSGGGWETASGDMGVVGFINDNGIFRAIYDANNAANLTGGGTISRNIGGFTSCYLPQLLVPAS